MQRDYGREFFEAAIEVPSGKLAVGNDFRDLYPGCPDYDVNEKVGIKLTFEWYAKNGLLHGFVGNSCPSVFQDGDSIHIASPKIYDENDEELPKSEWGIPGKEVASICTDLWWYSIADYDDFVSRGGREPKDVIKVTPGRYVIQHRIDASGWTLAPYIYATIQKSDRPIEKWAMPEEGAVERITNLLPWDFSSEDIFIYLRSKHEHVGKRYLPEDYEFKGIEIHGILPNKDPEKNTILIEFLVQPEELRNAEDIAKRILTDWEENHDREIMMEKLMAKLREEDKS